MSDKTGGGVELIVPPHLDKLYDTMKELAASNREIANCLKVLANPVYRFKEFGKEPREL